MQILISQSYRIKCSWSVHWRSSFFVLFSGFDTERQHHGESSMCNVVKAAEQHCVHIWFHFVWCEYICFCHFHCIITSFAIPWWCLKKYKLLPDVSFFLLCLLWKVLEKKKSPWFSTQLFYSETSSCPVVLMLMRFSVHSALRHEHLPACPFYICNGIVPIYTLHSHACTVMPKCLPGTFFSLESPLHQSEPGK